jgi:hypothetical protein
MTGDCQLAQARECNWEWKWEWDGRRSHVGVDAAASLSAGCVEALEEADHSHTIGPSRLWRAVQLEARMQYAACLCR